MRKIMAIVVVALAGCLLAACIEQASEQEVDAMCKKLVELRGVADPAEADRAMGECKAQAASDGVSKEVASCRIKADSTDTYWNRCR